MGAVSLLQEAEAAGLSVRVDGDRLVVRGPKSAGGAAFSCLWSYVVLLTDG